MKNTSDSRCRQVVGNLNLHPLQLNPWWVRICTLLYLSCWISVPSLVFQWLKIGKKCGDYSFQAGVEKMFLIPSSIWEASDAQLYGSGLLLGCNTRKRTFIHYFSWSKWEHKSREDSWGGSNSARAQSVTQSVCTCVCNSRWGRYQFIFLRSSPPLLGELQRLLVPELMKSHWFQHRETWRVSIITYQSPAFFWSPPV